MTKFSYLFKTVSIFPSSREVVVQTVTTSISEYPSLPKSINVAVFCRFGQFGCLWKLVCIFWCSFQTRAQQHTSLPAICKKCLNRQYLPWCFFPFQFISSSKALNARASSFPKNKNPISFFLTEYRFMVSSEEKKNLIDSSQ